MERFPPTLRDRLGQCDVLVLIMPIFDSACMEEDIGWLHDAGVPQVIVVGTKNFGWNPNVILAMSEADRIAFRTSVIPDVVAANDEARRRIPAANFVDLIAALADDEGRVPLLTPAGELISEDGGHLTRAGARYVGQRLFEHPLLRPLRDPPGVPR
jgi:hypothetical protein